MGKGRGNGRDKDRRIEVGTSGWCGRWGATSCKEAKLAPAVLEFCWGTNLLVRESPQRSFSTTLRWSLALSEQTSSLRPKSSFCETEERFSDEKRGGWTTHVDLDLFFGGRGLVELAIKLVDVFLHVLDLALPVNRVERTRLLVGGRRRGGSSWTLSFQRRSCERGKRSAGRSGGAGEREVPGVGARGLGVRSSSEESSMMMVFCEALVHQLQARKNEGRRTPRVALPTALSLDLGGGRCCWPEPGLRNLVSSVKSEAGRLEVSLGTNLQQGKAG